MNENVTVRHQRNKQINRTKQDFETALFELLKTKKISELKVDDLVKKAGYSRRTFYRHFQTIEEIVKLRLKTEILSMFDLLRENSQKSHSFPKTVVAFFAFWQGKKALLFLLQKQNLFYLLQQITFENIGYSALNDFLIDERDENVEYVQYFALSGMFSLLEIWLKNGAKKSPAEMGMIANDIEEHM